MAKDIQRYRKLTCVVEAYQIEEEASFAVGDNTAIGEVGDYAIQNARGQWVPCAKTYFEANYVKISPPRKS